MKQKILSLFFLTVILPIAFVSAANFTVTTSTPSDLTKSRTNTSFLLTPNLPTAQSINIAITLPQQINDTKGNVINLNPPFTIPFNNIINGETKGPVALTYNAGTVPANFIIGKYTVNAVISSTDTTNSSNTLTQNVPINFINDFCTSGENGTDLSISRVDIRNEDGDDTEWKPLDSIIIKAEVSNDGTERVKEVYLELGLINSDGKNIIKDMDDLSDRKISVGSISDGKDATKEFKFTVPFDFNEENYRLVVKAYSDDKGQKNLCVAHSSDLDNNYYNVISGTRETDENKQVIVTNVILSPETSAQCSDKVQLSGEVANIGDIDYEDKIKVTLFNKELGMNTLDEISTDLSQGDSSSFSFDFDIPQNAAEKTYTLEMRTYYDYDTGDKTYNLDSDETFTKTIKVEGNCQKTPTAPTTAEPSISAELDLETPEAIAGKDVAIRAIIRNNDNKDVSYTISVSDNTAWSSLVSIEPKKITIPAGQSRDVIVTLKVDNDAEANNEFTIKATYGDNQIKQYKGSVEVTKPQVALDIVKHFQDNWYIYLIVLVNLILIIAIIAVIRKMMKPRKA